MASLARGQHGVVGRRQLLALGMSASGIKHLVVAGRLHPVHRGVYAVGHLALTPQAQLLAVVLAFGTRTAASHRSAVVLHGLLDDGPHPIHVTTTSTSGGRRPGVIVHETRRLAGADLTRSSGIPVSVLPRALVALVERHGVAGRVRPGLERH